MSAAAGGVNWRTTGEGLSLQRAREVARSHGVPLDVVLHLPAGVIGYSLDSVEDHGVVETDHDGRHLTRFSDYDLFMDIFGKPSPSPRYQGYRRRGRLNVIIMPYADLASCKKIDELSRAATPHLDGYNRIMIANRDLLLRKLRAAAAVDDEARRVRDLAAKVQSLGHELFPTNKYPRSVAAHGLRPNREIAMERLIKAHLDAKQYGDAHDLLLLLDRRKHDPCRGPADDSSKDLAENRKAVAHQLEGYREELEGKLGTAPLEQWPERVDVLRMAARRELERELDDAHRQVIDILETAVQRLETIAEQLLGAGTQPSLLGFGC